MKQGTKAVYRYFDLKETERISIDYAGEATLSVNGNEVIDGKVLLKSEDRIIEIEVIKGRCDIYSFKLE